MDHPLRLIPFLSVALLAANPSAADENLLEATIQWSDSDHSPAVPTHHPTWLIGVAPAGGGITVGSTADIIVGEDIFAAKVIHYDDANALSLIETQEAISGLKVTQLANKPLPAAGAKLNCWKPGSSCPTTVAGKEYSVRGEPHSSPLLKVHVANAEEFCEPGTPLVCGNGKLFGILTEVVSTETGEAHAIPASCLHKLLTEFERYRQSGRVWVGLVFEEHAQTPQVVEVRDGSPAEKAGLKPGDVILGVGDHEMSDLDDLTQTVHLLIAGEAIEITILRGQQKKTLELVPEFAGSEVASASQGG